MVISAAIAVALVITALAAVYGVSVSNSEVHLRNTIGAKQRDNVSEYDNMWKKIAQTAKVTSAQKDALVEILQAHAEARRGGSSGSGSSVVTWLRESIPDVDTTTFNNLQNIIAGSRDRFTVRQKELLDLKRKHDTLLDSFPSGPLLATLGREKVDVVIVTSTRAKDRFAAGTDDDLGLSLDRD